MPITRSPMPPASAAPAPSDATKGIDLDAHEARLRRDGFTVLERIVPADTVASLVEAVDRVAREHGLGYARTRFEGLRTLRINNLLALDDSFWQVPLQPSVLALAERILSHAASLGHGPLAYARVDMAAGADGAPLLMELEVSEPSLFLDRVPDRAPRFVKAVEHSLGYSCGPGATSP
jgi:hypothetical protein